MPNEDTRGLEITFLIKKAASELEGKDYCAKYMGGLLCAFDRFGEYALKIGQELYSPELGRDFLASYYAQRETKHSAIIERAINILTDYANHGKVLRRTKAPDGIWNGVLGPYFSEYYCHYKTLGWSESSLVHVNRHLSAFLSHLENAGITKMAEVDAAHLYTLLGTRFNGYSKKMKNRVLRDIRNFLEYHHTRGVETRIFDHAFPHVRAFDESEGIPTVFTKEEVSRLLSSVDRKSPIGKRDYAILLIASRYGMRACDIKNLKFENIDWQEEKLSFVQSKTGVPLTLPLFEDIGWSIIDYIDNGRPGSSNEHIFIIHNAPYDRFIGSMNHLITKYLNIAKIPIRPHTKPGIHAFRHTLASEMLRGGEQISSIKEVLGHASITTTSKYQRIDVGQLACCALEVPHAKN